MISYVAAASITGIAVLLHVWGMQFGWNLRPPMLRLLNVMMLGILLIANVTAVGYLITNDPRIVERLNPYLAICFAVLCLIYAPYQKKHYDTMHRREG